MASDFAVTMEWSAVADVVQSPEVPETVVPSVIKPLHSLWNEVIGFLFLSFAAILLRPVWRGYHELQSDPAYLIKFLLTVFFFLIMLGFGWNPRALEGQEDLAIVKVLVAGATGAVGRHAVQQLLAAGHFVRALSCRPEPPAGPGSQEPHAAELTEAITLAGSCAGIDAVIACAGASLHIGAIRQRAGFLDVDLLSGKPQPAGQARRSGVRRFIYVSEDIRAHERISEEVATSGIPSAMIPTHPPFLRLCPLAALGSRWLCSAAWIGAERTNPIHEAEVARACVEALSGGAERRTIGGPEDLHAS